MEGGEGRGIVINNQIKIKEQQKVMETTKSNIVLILSLAATIILLVLLSSFSTRENATTGTNAEIIIIANPGNPITTLSAAQVKEFYLREKTRRWPAINKNIRPTDRKTHCEEQEVFYKKVLGMLADDVERYFISRQYQNAEKSQDKFATDKEIIEFVGTEVGAIGFVNAASLNTEAKGKIKVLLRVN